jgi:phosphoenolpyruvate synthase/pyruvate phosphate dikinase
MEIRPSVGGGTQRVEVDGRLEEAWLNHAQLHNLAALGAQVEVHYGAPQDIDGRATPPAESGLYQRPPKASPPESRSR